MKQCPTCGRADVDWSDPKNRKISQGLSKTRQRPDAEDRTIRYRDWRRTFGAPYYVSDIDQVEWRAVDGEIKPVALLELTRVDGTHRVPDSYLGKILERFKKRDGQSSIIVNIASMLDVKAWVVLFRWDLTEFWVYDLSGDRGWFKTAPEKYQKWIRGMY